MTDLLDRRIVFVTGKGGVGKTTVAAALALLAATRGRRTLVGEVDAKGDLADFFSVEPTTFKAREVQPNLFAMSMHTEESLKEYLTLQLKFPMMARIGPLAKVFDFVATAAPGVREVLTVGKFLWEVAQRNYDLVVVDAASSGHVIAQLCAPQAINELVSVGMIRQQTGWMIDILSDPGRTGLCIVTTPEEMPVKETVELAGRVEHETSLDVATVVVNRVLPELFGRGEEAAFGLLEAPTGRAALLDAVGPGAGPIIDAARLAVTLRRTRAEHLEELRAALPARLPLLFVPELFTRAHGLRSTRLVADALSAELGY